MQWARGAGIFLLCGGCVITVVRPDDGFRSQLAKGCATVAECGALLRFAIIRNATCGQVNRPSCEDTTVDFATAKQLQKAALQAQRAAQALAAAEEVARSKEQLY